MIPFIIHYSLHLVAPWFIATTWFHNDRKRAYLLMLATMAVDLDHLLAQPIYDANRCSIGFHPLHSYLAIAVYFVALFMFPKLRIVCIGLLFHMLTDGLDCLIAH